MADLAKLAIEVDYSDVKSASSELESLAQASGRAEAATSDLGRNGAQELADSMGAATSSVEGLGLSLGELAGPIGLAAGSLVGLLADHLIEMATATQKAAEDEQKRHEQFMKNLQDEIDALNDRAAKANDPYALTTKQTQELERAKKEVEDYKRQIQETQNTIASLGASEYSTVQLKFFQDQLGEATKKVKELQDAYGTLGTSARVADAATLAQQIHKQAEEYRLGTVAILEQRVASASLTATQRAEAEADLEVIKAHQNLTKARREQIPETQRLLAQLELEVNAYGKITSATSEYKLATADLTATQAQELAQLQARTQATLDAEAAQKSAAEQAKERAKEEAERLRELTKAEHEHAQALRQTLETYAPSAEAGVKFIQTLANLNELLQKNEITAGEYAQGIAKAREEYARLKAQGDSALQDLIDFTDIAAQRMGDAFGQFVTTGKLQFKDLVQSILADFARLEASKAFTELAGYIVGALSGPSISYPDLSASVPTGGSGYTPMDTSLPTLAGPAPSLAPISAAPSARAGIVATTNITVNNGPGGPQVQAQGSGSPESAQLAQRLRGAVLQVLMDERRPGGVLDQDS